MDLTKWGRHTISHCEHSLSKIIFAVAHENRTTFGNPKMGSIQFRIHSLVLGSSGCMECRVLSFVLVERKTYPDGYPDPISRHRWLVVNLFKSPCLNASVSGDLGTNASCANYLVLEISFCFYYEVYSSKSFREVVLIVLSVTQSVRRKPIEELSKQ